MAETISQGQYDEKLGNNELVLAFVGMSNCGKSWSARRLASEQGWEHLDCDSEIKKALNPILEAGGFTGPGIKDTEALAAWMGQPGDRDFREREKEYLELEEYKMREILAEVRGENQAKNTVVDTTGSVVHLAADIREELGQRATVVLFDITPDMEAEMYESYIAQPKPVVWGPSFDGVRVGESRAEARQRCYPNLLAKRQKLYRQMADVIVPREVKFEFADTSELLSYVREELPA